MQKLLILLVVAAIGVFFFAQRMPTNDEQSVEQSAESTVEPPTAPFTAQFLIYTNGTKRIFTAPMYHQQSSDVYLTASNPSVVHVAQADITWQAFFDTLPFSLDESCLTTGTGQRFCSNDSEQLSFYLNGIESPQALNKLIQPNDQLLVTFGPNNDPNIASQLESF